MKLPVSTLTERLRVGLIQTSLDYEIAWATSPKMSKVEEDHAVSEIGRFVAGFREEKPGPDIVVMPELAVPHGFLPRLRVMARTLSAVIIAGLDYRDRSTATERIVSNEAVVIVPNRWRKRQISSHTSVRYIGKTYCSHGEQQRLDQQKYGFSGDNAIWVFDGDDAGRFGIVICYDFLDLERVASYRGQIQHLFVLAYNKDIRSFQHAAEAMARMVFCNVLVCNAGYYGGSLVVSPYRRPERRTIYQHSGSRLATAQMITIPVKALHQHQLNRGITAGSELEFKSLPAGYEIQQ